MPKEHKKKIKIDKVCARNITSGVATFCVKTKSINKKKTFSK